MKRWKTSVAWLMVVSLLLSLFCVCALVFHPQHDEDAAEHCVFCQVAQHADQLLRGDTRSHAAFGLALLCLLCFGAVELLGRLRLGLFCLSPVQLKTKLLN
ncbi:MAG: hypothetical protein IKN72_04930 [Clostridia bacterium]|nr:hypothetical protein [Clostridia bacterium]MBR3552716.1 hypothetical protein [Clostridia bacterium]